MNWETGQRIRFDILPEDIQVLIGNLIEGEPEEYYSILRIPVGLIPDIPLDTTGRDRGIEHAKGMIGENTPPILISGNKILDGKHRIAAAKMTGRQTIHAIDIGPNQSEHDVLAKFSMSEKFIPTNDGTYYLRFAPDEIWLKCEVKKGKVYGDWIVNGGGNKTPTQYTTVEWKSPD